MSEWAFSKNQSEDCSSIDYVINKSLVEMKRKNECRGYFALILEDCKEFIKKKIRYFNNTKYHDEFDLFQEVTILITNELGNDPQIRYKPYNEFKAIFLKRVTCRLYDIVRKTAHISKSEVELNVETEAMNNMPAQHTSSYNNIRDFEFIDPYVNPEDYSTVKDMLKYIKKIIWEDSTLRDTMKLDLLSVLGEISKPTANTDEADTFTSQNTINCEQLDLSYKQTKTRQRALKQVVEHLYTES